MSELKYICFKGKEELLDVSEKIEVYPLGQLVFSILDIDWAACLHTAVAVRDRLNTMKCDESRTIFEGFDNPSEAAYCVVAEYYHSLVCSFKADHPCFYHLFSAQNIIKTLSMYEAAFDTAQKNIERIDYVRKTGNQFMAADFTVRLFESYPAEPDWLEGYSDIIDQQIIEVTFQFMDHLVESLSLLNCFQTRLLQIVEFGLDAQGQYAELKPEQRLHLMQAVQFEPYVKCLSLYEKLGVRRRQLNYDAPELSPDAPITKETIVALKAIELTSAKFYCSSDVCALAFLEFEHLCMANCCVRRCGHCGRYFLSFSQNTCYCDRIADVERGRSCKDIAAMAKYLNKVRRDEAKALYRKYANTYQMRCSRASACYPRAAYEDWKDEAKMHLDAYQRGEIDLQQLDERIRIPEKR